MKSKHFNFIFLALCVLLEVRFFCTASLFQKNHEPSIWEDLTSIFIEKQPDPSILDDLIKITNESWDSIRSQLMTTSKTIFGNIPTFLQSLSKSLNNYPATLPPSDSNSHTLSNSDSSFSVAAFSPNSLIKYFTGAPSKTSRPSILQKAFDFAGVSPMFNFLESNTPIPYFIDLLLSVLIIILSLVGCYSVRWWYKFLGAIFPLVPLFGIFLLYLVWNKAIPIPLLYQLSYLCWLGFKLLILSFRVLIYTVSNLSSAHRKRFAV